QVIVGRSVEIENLADAVDDHAGRRVTLHQGLRERGQAGRCRRAGYSSVHDRQMRTADRKLEPLVTRPADASINPPLCGDGLEQVRVRTDAFGAPEEKTAAVHQREMQERNEPVLHRLLEIDQQVATTDELELRERRIAHQALLRENHRVAKLLADAYAVLGLQKVAGR